MDTRQKVTRIDWKVAFPVDMQEFESNVRNWDPQGRTFDGIYANAFQELPIPRIVYKVPLNSQLPGAPLPPKRGPGRPRKYDRDPDTPTAYELRMERLANPQLMTPAKKALVMTQIEAGESKMLIGKWGGAKRHASCKVFLRICDSHDGFPTLFLMRAVRRTWAAKQLSGYMNPNSRLSALDP